MEPYNPNKSQEKRRYHRHAVKLQTRISRQHAQEIDGTALDICEDGLFLSLPGPYLHQAPFHHGEALSLLLNLPISDGQVERLLIPAQVMRVIDAGLGIRFSPEAGTARAKIQAFTRTLPTRKDPGHAPTVGAEIRTLARAVHRKIDDLRVEQILLNLIADIRDALWAAVDTETLPEQRQDLTDDAMALSALPDYKLAASLSRALEYDESLPSGFEAESNNSEMTLLAQDDFENWLDSSMLINHLEDDLGEHLKVLRSQAAKAFGDESLLRLLPSKLSLALDELSRTLQLRLAAKHICFRCAQRTLPRQLGPYYRELSRAWEEIGLLPEGIETKTLKIARSRNDSRQTAPSVQTQTPPPTGDGRPTKAGADDTLTADALAETLKSLPSDVLQIANLESSGRSLKEKVLSLLGQVSPETNHLPLESQLNDRITSTDRVINHILRDVDGSSRMHDWINQLMMRILASAIEDPGFYQNPQHPLLDVINRLEHIDQYLPSTMGPEGAKLAEQIESLIHTTCVIAPSDIDSYQLVVAEFDQLQQTCSSRFQKNAQRAIQRLEGADRAQQAKSAVRQYINTALNGHKIPKTFADLIDGAWQKYLELLFLRGGPESENWHKAWSVVTNIRDILAQSAMSPRETTNCLSRLLEEIGKGLAYIGYDRVQGQRLLSALAKTAKHICAGLMEDVEAVVYQGSQTQVPKLPLMPEISGLTQTTWAQTLDQARKLQISDSIIRKQEDKDEFMRLIWKNRNGTELAFADTTGKHVTSHSLAEIATGLLTHQLRILQAWDSDITDRATRETLQEMQQRISYHQTHDPLTGLNNRQQLTGKLARALETAGDSSRSTCLGFIEIDHFEEIDSTCGYAASEALLKQIAKLLQGHFQNPHSLAFLGGRRFAYLITRQTTDSGDGEDIAEGVRAEIRNTPFVWERKNYAVSVSVGITLLDTDRPDPDHYLSSAALACKAANEAGGNRVILFRDEDQALVENKERMHWLHVAENTLVNQRMRLRSQLIAHANPERGAVHHHEVLLSVYDDDRRSLELEHFINTAESYNLMDELDRLVIEHTFDWVNRNPRLATTLGGLAINLSGQSLSKLELPAYIQQQLSNCDLPPEFFSFEVTETAAIASLDRASLVIDGIRSLGCSLALDDFGTGMSSYNYLKELPVNYVKIDGSFVRNILTNPHDQAIVRSINEIAHFMGMQTIAEYVESWEIRRRLIEIGIDYVQGYAIARPVFLDERRENAQAQSA